jgi:methylenetetrahydrofolate dehydrogenase (NADP+)/methenyltetrahydrofolate cyclohydrolase
MIILDGRKTSSDIKDEIAVAVNEITASGSRAPHLAAVIVGEDGASLTYVGSKVRACKRVGFDSTLVKLPETITEDQLLNKVDELNNDQNIDGYIVQLPLPSHIDSQKILMAVDPAKDVDGFHPTNFGKMALNMKTFIPATPFGIMELLKKFFFFLYVLVKVIELYIHRFHYYYLAHLSSRVNLSLKYLQVI